MGSENRVDGVEGGIIYTAVHSDPIRTVAIPVRQQMLRANEVARRGFNIPARMEERLVTSSSTKVRR